MTIVKGARVRFENHGGHGVVEWVGPSARGNLALIRWHETADVSLIGADRLVPLHDRVEPLSSSLALPRALSAALSGGVMGSSAATDRCEQCDHAREWHTINGCACGKDCECPFFVFGQAGEDARDAAEEERGSPCPECLGDGGFGTSPAFRTTCTACGGRGHLGKLRLSAGDKEVAGSIDALNGLTGVPRSAEDREAWCPACKSGQRAQCIRIVRCGTDIETIRRATLAAHNPEAATEERRRSAEASPDLARAAKLRESWVFHHYLCASHVDTTIAALIADVRAETIAQCEAAAKAGIPWRVGESAISAVTVRDMGGDGTGPWRLFVGDYGIAQWPGWSGHTEPKAYAHEVARCLRLALGASPSSGESQTNETTGTKEK